jgi:hypothetical protein
MSDMAEYYGADEYDEPEPDIEVRKNDRGVWGVWLDGDEVSTHRTHDAARVAAQGHRR